MSNLELLQKSVAENPNMQITLLGSDLLGFLDQMRGDLVNEMRDAMTNAVFAVRQDLMAGLTALNQNRTMTPNEVAQMLKVDLSTLYKWNKRGILTRQRIGGKVLYRAEDVERYVRTQRGGVSVCG